MKLLDFKEFEIVNINDLIGGYDRSVIDNLDKTHLTGIDSGSIYADMKTIDCDSYDDSQGDPYISCP